MTSHDPMTSAEASDELGIPRRTLTRWIAKGRVQVSRKMPGIRGAYLLDRSVVEQLAEELAHEEQAS